MKNSDNMMNTNSEMYKTNTEEYKTQNVEQDRAQHGVQKEVQNGYRTENRMADNGAYKTGSGMYKSQNGVYKTQNGVYKTHSVGQALQKTLAKKLSKEEYLTIKLICDWHLIAPKIHQISKPLRIYLDQEMLVLATQPGYSMTLQYQNDEICWSVNKYLNSQQITRILIKTDFYYNK